MYPGENYNNQSFFGSLQLLIWIHHHFSLQCIFTSTTLWGFSSSPFPSGQTSNREGTGSWTTPSITLQPFTCEFGITRFDSHRPEQRKEYVEIISISPRCFSSNTLISLGGGGASFEITATPLISLHITVVPAMFSMKLRFFVFVTWLNY